MKPRPITRRPGGVPHRPQSPASVLIAVAAALLAGCGSNPPFSPTPRSPGATSPGASPTGALPSSPPSSTTPSGGAALPELFPLPPGVVPAPGTIRIGPATARTAELGRPYPYALQHCGVGSPIDFDGSLWDVIGAQNGRDAEVTDDQVGELINAGTGTMTLVDPNLALFRTPSGLILGLQRHEGPKLFQGCA